MDLPQMFQSDKVTKRHLRTQLKNRSERCYLTQSILRRDSISVENFWAESKFAKILATSTSSFCDSSDFSPNSPRLAKMPTMGHKMDSFVNLSPWEPLPDMLLIKDRKHPQVKPRNGTKFGEKYKNLYMWKSFESCPPEVLLRMKSTNSQSLIKLNSEPFVKPQGTCSERSSTTLNKLQLSSNITSHFFEVISVAWK